MTFYSAMIVTTALLVTFILTACTSIRPSDPDYADWVRCDGHRDAFGVSEKVRACMDQKKTERRAKLEEKQRKEQDEQKKMAERDARDAKRQVEIAEREQAQRRACGNDYGKLSVGMTLDRVKQCWPRFGWFRLSGEINRADGVVSIYSMPMDDRGSLAYAIGVSEFYVMKGKVVGWTR